MGGGGKGGTSTQVSSVGIPPEIAARYGAVWNRAQSAADQPFQEYGGQFVAPFNPTQQNGLDALRGAIQGADLGPATSAAWQGFSSAQPYLGKAATATGLGAAAVNPNALDISAYLSPYQQQVVDATMAQLRQQQTQQQNDLRDQMILGGAFGGDRAGIAAANLTNQQNLASASALAGLNQSNYSQALGAAQQQQGLQYAAAAANRAAQQQAAGQYLNLGNTAYQQGLGLSSQLAGLVGQGFGQQMQYAQGLLGVGTLQQQTSQALDTALYNQFLQERGYPFQTAQFLSNIATGSGPLYGSTTSASSFQPQPFFSDERVKENIVEIGRTHDGQKIIKFNYKGDSQPHIGLSAQDVEKHHPDAVGSIGGIKVVDYDAATRDAERTHRAGGGALPYDLGAASVLSGAPYDNKTPGAPGMHSFEGIPGLSFNRPMKTIVPLSVDFGSPGGVTGSGGDAAGGVAGTGGIGGSATGGQGGSAAAGVGDDGGTYAGGGRIHRAGGGMIMGTLPELISAQQMMYGGLGAAAGAANPGASSIVPTSASHPAQLTTAAPMRTQQLEPTMQQGLGGIKQAVEGGKSIGDLYAGAKDALVGSAATKDTPATGGLFGRGGKWAYDPSSWWGRNIGTGSTSASPTATTTGSSIGDLLNYPSGGFGTYAAGGRIARVAGGSMPYGGVSILPEELFDPDEGRKKLERSEIETPRSPGSTSGNILGGLGQLAGVASLGKDLWGLGSSAAGAIGSLGAGASAMAPADMLAAGLIALRSGGRVHRDAGGRTHLEEGGVPDVLPPFDVMPKTGVGDIVIPDRSLGSAKIDYAPDQLPPISNYDWQRTLREDQTKRDAARTAPFDLGLGSTNKLMPDHLRDPVDVDPKTGLYADALPENYKPGLDGATTAATPTPTAATETPTVVPVKAGQVVNDTTDRIWSGMLRQESPLGQFDPKTGLPVESSKGARGAAQVMPSTGPEAAKLAGLPWNPELFFRGKTGDPAKDKEATDYNLALGRAYYNEQVRTFGDPVVAAAAYNAGPDAVRRAQVHAQRTGRNYLDFLPEETRNYVAIVTGQKVPPRSGGEQPVALNQPAGQPVGLGGASGLAGAAPATVDGSFGAASPEAMSLWGKAGDWLDRNERYIVPGLAFLGNMLASPSRTLLGSVGTGLVAAAPLYAQLGQRQQGLEVSRRQAETDRLRLGITERAQDISVLAQLRELKASRSAGGLPPDPNLDAQINALAAKIARSGGIAPTGSAAPSSIDLRPSASPGNLPAGGGPVSTAPLPAPGASEPTPAPLAASPAPVPAAGQPDRWAMPQPRYDDAAFRAQLDPNNDPVELTRRSQEMRGVDPARAETLAAEARRIQEQWTTTGRAVGRNGPVEIPGWAEWNQARLRIPENQKTLQSETEAAKARQQARLQVNAIRDLLAGYESGNLAGLKSEAQALARAVGIELPSTATTNAEAFQKFIKDAYGTMLTNAGLSKNSTDELRANMTRAFAHPDLQPGANRAILAQTIGALDQADKFYQDITKQVEKYPHIQVADWYNDWLRQPENSLEGMTEKARRETPVMGDVPPKRSELKEGYQYILTPNDAVRLFSSKDVSAEQIKKQFGGKKTMRVIAAKNADGSIGVKPVE